MITRAYLEPLLKKFDWYRNPASLWDDDFRPEAESIIEGCLQDDSDEMKAILILNMVQRIYIQRMAERPPKTNFRTPTRGFKRFVQDLIDKLPIRTKRKQALEDLQKTSAKWENRRRLGDFSCGGKIDSLCQEYNELMSIHENNQPK